MPMVALAPVHRHLDAAQHAVWWSASRMIEKYEPDYADMPPDDGLLSLRDLYILQPVSVRQEHAHYLMDRIWLDKRLMLFIDLARLKAVPNDVHALEEYESFIENHAQYMSDEELQHLSEWTHDELLICLGHLALSFATTARLRWQLPILPPEEIW